MAYKKSPWMIVGRENILNMPLNEENLQKITLTNFYSVKLINYQKRCELFQKHPLCKTPFQKRT